MIAQSTVLRVSFDLDSGSVVLVIGSTSLPARRAGRSRRIHQEARSGIRLEPDGQRKHRRPGSSRASS